MDYNEIGKRIRKQRRLLDITQEQLAELVGVSASFVGHIERGNRIPSVETLYNICKALGCKMEHIIEG